MFDVVTGIQQGCILTSFLLLTVTDLIMK